VAFVLHTEQLFALSAGLGLVVFLRMHMQLKHQTDQLGVRL
jgi:hypothetical protein